jgi:hypothetical protein
MARIVARKVGRPLMQHGSIMRAAGEDEVYWDIFVWMCPFGDDEEETGLGEEMKYVTEEEEYDLWTERRER